MASHKKLVRATDKKMIGGVAAGIAEYSGVDPIIIRFFFFTLVIAAGLGFIVYGLLWAIVPEKPMAGLGNGEFSSGTTFAADADGL